MNNNVTVLNGFPVWLPRTQTWMFNQINGLQKKGVNAHVVCERLENIDNFYIENIHSLDSVNGFLRLYDKALRKSGIRNHLQHPVRVGRNIGANIFHSHFGNIGWTNLDVVKKLSIKHVVTFYGMDINKLPTAEPIWRDRYKELFSTADVFLTEGRFMAESLLKLGCNRDKCIVQHIGIDVNKFKYIPRKWNGTEKFKILIASSFVEKKGIPYAIMAINKLSNIVNIELTIIGDSGNDSSSKAEKVKIKNEILKLNKNVNINMLGYVTHEVMLKEAYNNHVFLHPSVFASDGDSEGGAPVGLMEMMATGMPVVSTLHCDIPEVFGDKLRYLLAPERDSEKLYQILISLIDCRNDWSEMLSVARNRIESNYSIDKQIALLAKIYNKTLNDI